MQHVHSTEIDFYVLPIPILVKTITNNPCFVLVIYNLRVYENENRRRRRKEPEPNFIKKPVNKLTEFFSLTTHATYTMAKESLISNNAAKAYYIPDKK